MGKNTLIVTGMDRSGTSWVAGAMHASGVLMGEQFYGPGRGNPFGHFEDKEFLQFHIDLLAQVDSEGLHKYGMVDALPETVVVAEKDVSRALKLIETRAKHDLWGFKDPRALLFLDLWKQLIPDVKVICLYRNPLEICISMFNRGDGFAELGGVFRGFQHRMGKAVSFKQANPNQMLLCNIHSVIESPQQLEQLIYQRFEISIDELGANLERSFVPQSFSRIPLSTDTWVKFYQSFPDAAQLFERLGELADMPLHTKFEQISLPAVRAMSEDGSGNLQEQHDGERRQQDFFSSLIDDALADERVRKKVINGLLENVKTIGKLHEQYYRFQRYERLIQQQQAQIEHAQAQLSVVRYSKSYRLARILQISKIEFLDGGLSGKSTFIRRGLAYLGLAKAPGVAVPQDSIDYARNVLQTAINSLTSSESNAPVLGQLSETSPVPSQPEPSKRPLKLSSRDKPRVAYLTNQLFDWYTQAPRYGGGERYCLMLGTLLKDLGYEVSFYQPSHKEFRLDYHGFPVKSLPLRETYSEFQYGVANQFHDISLDYDHVIYNMPEYSSGKMRDDAVTICHGIWFDHSNYSYPISFRTSEWFDHLYRAFSQPRHIISVDTNSISVIRALWPELADKMTYIPNWVDAQQFKPVPEKRSDKLTVIFPRRSQINRGSRILADILKNIPHECRFLWVGEGDAEDTQLIKNLARRDKRLSYLSVPFEDMPRMYQQSDICVIPTIACEGTSLSCLEGLASGCATIATSVGGLPDLIQPGVNGILVEPAAHDIADAVNFLIENPAQREHLQLAGPIWAQHFSIEKWRERWISQLHKLGWID
jgi:glycosyltransferase involved in cell wall biosynthesis